MLWIFALICLLVVLPNHTAHAYLDPGSGSFIVQILVASLLGALVSVRLFWQRIVSFFRRSSRDNSEKIDHD